MNFREQLADALNGTIDAEGGPARLMASSEDSFEDSASQLSAEDIDRIVNERVQAAMEQLKAAQENESGGIFKMFRRKKVSPKKLVILGAGYAGQHVATSLDKHKDMFDITMIDARSHFVHKISGLRAATLGGDWAEATCVPLHSMLKNGRFVQGKVDSSENGVVRLQNGQEFKYDYLVCATGARSFSVGEPGLECTDKQSMVQFYKRAAGAIKSASKIVVVGGGAVGVELAGEVASQYSKTGVTKSVTIVHAGDQVLSNQPVHMKPKYYRMLDEQFDKLNIQRKFNVKVVGTFPEPEGGLTEWTAGKRSVILSNGETIEADLILWCIGMRRSTGFYPQEWLNTSGQVKVTESLLVEGTDNVFAPGDLNNVRENKMKYTATAQADIVVKNLKRLAAGKVASEPYKPSPVGVVLTNLGPNHGTSDFFGTAIAGATVTSQFKGKSLNVSDSYKLANLKAPVLYNGKVGEVIALTAANEASLHFIEENEMRRPSATANP
jgi:NADH dehydrogenase FAD-containing subunit